MADGTVRIMCPNLTCRRVLAVPSKARGKVVRCKNCGTNIKIPESGGVGGGGQSAAAANQPAKA